MNAPDTPLSVANIITTAIKVARRANGVALAVDDTIEKFHHNAQISSSNVCG
jgi:hypothetical protein